MKRYSKCVSFAMMVVLILVMVAATLIEKSQGSGAVVYGSWWFVALWALLVVAALLYIFHQKMQKRPVLLLLHLSLALILVGAGVTYIWGKQGAVELRLYQPIGAMEKVEGGYERFPFELMLKSFEVQYYPDTDVPMDYVSEVSISHDSNSDNMRISMNKIGEYHNYRFYQASYHEDLRGSILSVSYDPWGIGITYTGYALLFVSMLLLLLLPQEGFRMAVRQFRPGEPIGMVKLVIRIVCVLALIVAAYQYSMWRVHHNNGGYLPPVLRSPLLTIHVSIIMAAYVLLIVIFFISLFALFLHNQERVCKLQILSRLLLYPALFFLAAGIFIGAIWANISWGRYWGWDPKEVWALITMLIYSFAMHRASLPLFAKPRFFHFFMVVAFLSVLMTYFGVNFLLGGMHSYANA